ncbi:MAG: shikimate dehydrogenase [Mycoplasmataceae bacterium]|nr:shikimate dehydrogenase [Mycoplasmataceae bacterium]
MEKNKIKKAAVIGMQGIEKYSLSPIVHNYFFKQTKIPGQYFAFPVEQDKLVEFLQKLIKEGYDGVNLTIPHKVEILKNKIINQKDESVLSIGATNTLKFIDGKIKALNTDGYGFITYLQEKNKNWNPKKTNALIYGAGGATRAIIFGLKKSGVKNITICNRTQENADLLAKEFSCKTIKWENKNKTKGFNLIINSTSCGMKNVNNLDITFEQNDKDTIVYDIVYTPLNTQFLINAQKKKLITIDGLGMLIYQAAKGFEIWFDKKPKVTKELFDLCLEKLNNQWSHNSWVNSLEKKHMPTYENQKDLADVKKKLLSKKDLINIDKLIKLNKDLANVEKNKSFIIMGGDCSEVMWDYKPSDVNATIKTLFEMKKILAQKYKNIFLFGRMAGQFAKPRSSDTEIVNGVTLSTYKGDIINKTNPNIKDRTPNPKYMLDAYELSAKKMELVEKYDDLFTCHEALLLDYEENFIKKNKNNEYYLSSTYLPWIGERTRNINSAHVEFLSNIINPVGIKVSEKTDTEDLIKIIKKINKNNVNGKIILIIRMGSEKINNFLPNIIKKIKESKLNVLWTSDPMHGNTQTIDNMKTRKLDDVISEIDNFIKVCKSNGVYPAGIHLEMTGLNVTECIGKFCENLKGNYTTTCDPRLNGKQCIYIATHLEDAKN